jgi:eukaryotic-like serine/threonine-protein kinase
MTIPPGTAIGSYEVEALLGAGGMGEVYRARDTRLGRAVAIKILPEGFRSDAERLTRFEREARSLAALNHRNIAAIHGIEERSGITALVLELVDGETLADRIRRGPLPLTSACDVARQIADALDAAHERGIVHRDLKPANIKITPDGTVKVLDFGLAKAAVSDDAAGSSQSATLTFEGTRAGVILGSPAYMSPEQARGLPVDRRTDVWAFGCVLYEMLSGRQAFDGATLTDVLGAVLEREPDWRALPLLPPHFVRLLQRCLDKDARRRLRDIADARADLEAPTSPLVPVPAASRPSPRLPWLIAAAALVALVALLVPRMWTTAGGTRSVDPTVERFVEPLPAGAELAPAPALAVSPDGRRLAYVAIANGVRMLYVRDLDQEAARRLAGTDGADQPFFSTDGRWIAFFADGTLRKVSVAGGAPLTLCEAPAARGGSWGPDDSIIFAGSPVSTLMRVAASGGKPEPMTTLDRTLNEASHRWPHILPDGKVLLYAAGPTVTAGDWLEAHVVAQSLETGMRRVVAPHGTFPHFTESGHLLYRQAGVIYGQSFDAARLEVRGEAVPVVQYVAKLGGINGGSTQFATAAIGTMLYVPGSAPEPQTLVWVGRDGTETPLATPVATYVHPRLSPDESRVAVTVVTPLESDIWVYDLTRSTGSRLTSGGRNLWPLWSPDGSRIAYASNRQGSTNVFWKPADGSGAEEQFTSTEFTNYPQSWSPDGTTLAVTDVSGARNTSVVMHPVDRTRAPWPYHAGQRSHLGAFSPDGRWYAYTSDETGQDHVYAMPYPGPGAAIQITTAGGSEPAWAKSGRELFFRRGNAMMAVDITPGPGGTLSVGTPRELFRGSYTPGAVRVGYDVSRDGRFLMVKQVGTGADPSRFNVVLNWPDDLKSRVAAR